MSANIDYFGSSNRALCLAKHVIYFAYIIYSCVVQNAFAAVDTPWLIEDFSTYSSTANFKTNPRGIYVSLVEPNGEESHNIARVSIDRTTGYNGLRQSMRYDFPDRSSLRSEYCHEYSIGVNMSLPTPTQEVWVEIAAKFGANFKTLAPVLTNPTLDCSQYSNPDYKFIFLRVHGISGRFNLLAGNGGNGWIWGYPGDTQGAGSDTPMYYGNSPLPFSTTGTPFDGNWHVYRMHAKVGAQGLAEWWFDGVKQPSFPSLNLSAATNIYGLALGRNTNQGPAEPQSLWWGKISVWNSDPGWTKLMRR